MQIATIGVVVGVVMTGVKETGIEIEIVVGINIEVTLGVEDHIQGIYLYLSAK